MRIITGSARGTKLLTREGSETRPTAERTKEAVFSKLQFDIEGRRVLDLFAGSGQLALEALSRGAAHATLCDCDKQAVDIIKKNAEKTRLSDRCTILRADYKDALLRLATLEKPFDIVFLDPPYTTGLLTQSLFLLCQKELLAPGALVVCESGNAEPEIPESLSVVTRAKYGIAHVTILTLKKEDDQ